MFMHILMNSAQLESIAQILREDALVVMLESHR